jgi:predicted phosphoribosyltransferase
MALYRDRRDAGRKLAAALERYRGRPGVTVLALPRGGVPVAYEVARALAAPLDVFIVRKLGFPEKEELAMGALASGGVRVLNETLLHRYHVPEPVVAAVVAREQRELMRREQAYRHGRPPAPVAGRTVILVDDGLATGSTMRAGVAGLRQRGPAHIAVAVPIAAPDTCAALAAVVDDIVCAATPEPFHAVGLWYDDFDQTGDDEVQRLLDAAARDTDTGAEAPGA